MKPLNLFCTLLTLVFSVAALRSDAQRLTGVYSFSKGLNKPNGTLYLIHFQPDSAFFYLSSLSGAPDFFSTDIKGFAQIDSNTARFKRDKCLITMQFGKNVVEISHDTVCGFEYPVAGQFKKTSPVAKRSATMLLNYTERPVKAEGDSLQVYSAPHTMATSRMVLCKAGDLKVVDEFRGFYLIDHRKFKTEFMWVPKQVFPQATKKLYMQPKMP